MGIVVAFPEARSAVRDGAERGDGSATVIILPVIRIERYDGGPGDLEPSNSSSGRKRRRRASRS
jgi:hypothetical protein